MNDNFWYSSNWVFQVRIFDCFPDVWVSKGWQIIASCIKNKLPLAEQKKVYPKQTKNVQKLSMYSMQQFN